MAFALDLFDLSKRVERAAHESTRARRSFDADTSPLESFRDVSGTKTLDALFEREPSLLEAPLRDALARWVRALLLDRMSYGGDRVLALARRAPLVVSPVHESTRVSWDDAWRELLVSSENVAHSWLHAIAEDADPIAGAAREAHVRRSEARERVEDKIGAQPGALWEKLGLPLPESDTRALAEAILVRTDDLAREHAREARRAGASDHAVTGILSALARDATPTFPARVQARWLEDLFAVHLRGVSIAPRLPTIVAGASTFAVALGAFGRAMRIGLAPRELPFALRASPQSLDAERFAVTWASLAGDVSFLRGALGATPSRARADRRSVARTMLATTRQRAARVLLRHDASRFEELGTRVFGAPLPRGLAGAWPLERADDDARLVATADALPLMNELVERFDEDWFKNPRAFEWMRARAVAPAISFDVATYVRDAGTDSAAASLAARLEGMLA